MNPFFNNSQPFIPPFQRGPNFTQLNNSFPFPPPNYVANEFIRNVPPFPQYFSPPNFFNPNFQNNSVSNNFSTNYSINRNNYQNISVYSNLNKANNTKAVLNTEYPNWIDNWIERNKTQLSQPPKPSSLTISQFRQVLKAIFKLNQAFETIQSCMSSQQSRNKTEETSKTIKDVERMNECVCYTLGECKYTDVNNHNVVTVQLNVSQSEGSMNNEHCSMHLHGMRLKELENKINELRGFVDDDVIKDVKIKLKKRYDQKKRKKLKKLEKIRSIKIKNEKVDMWLEKLRKAEEEKKKKKEVQEKADVVMSEVRKKISDVKRCFKVLSGVRKIRSLRVRNRDKASENQARFDHQMESLEEMMRVQLNNYKLEEKTLQVMMESEDRENEKKDMTGSTTNNEMEEYEQSLKQYLFGSEGERFPQSQSFNGDVASLIHIRREWDEYLAEERKEGFTEPTSLPPCWVFPSPPCNPAWKQFLTKKST